MKALALGAAALALTMSASSLLAQEVTLRLHQMLPPQATIPANALTPWAEKVMAESDGRIKIELYPSMQLGGAPPELFDQAKDGVVDLIWTVLGYTPGRFPVAETFELPFVVTNAEDTSRAFHEFMTKNAGDEFADVKVIAFHTHGPGLIHSKNPVTSLEDFKDLKIRGGSRVINLMLEELGSAPVGMPVPQVPESLSTGVIDAATIPWEVTPSLKIAELVSNHTSFTGENGLYTQTFVFAMNKDAYDRLPDDLKAIIDANSGPDVAAMMGAAMDAGDEVGLKIAQDRGNNVVVLDEAETARWREVAERIVERWITEMDAAGRDGEALLAEARALIAEKTQ
jgi:TRAP-type C4-dicarboxylate transport system substrate-binding protein